MYKWLLDGWRSVGFVALSTTLIYLSVVLGVRIGERRTLTEMTAYDFAVAIALGSIIGRTATTADPSYVKGVTAVASLLLCHHTLSLLRSRSTFLRRIIDRPPTELVRDGEIVGGRLRRAHMTEMDLAMVLREHGLDSVEQAGSVVLESRGAFSVVPRASRQTRARS